MTSKQMQRSIGGFPARWSMACICFISFTFLYITRVNINIAVVSMVNYSAIPRVNVSVSEECGRAPNQTDENDGENGEFAWDERTQALVVGSFFWGYILTQFVGGRMSEKVGTKIIVGASQTIAAILTMALPLFAQLGAVGVIIARVLLGFTQGVIFPSVQALIGNWAPPHERSGLISFIYSGTQIGTVIGMPLAGYIASTLGWRYVFYIEGVALLLFSIVWWTFLYDSPEQHPRISDKEKLYILGSLRYTGAPKIALPVPIYSMITSMRFWAILVSNFGNSWGFNVILSELPIYLKNILLFDEMNNSVYSALPYLLMWVFSLICGFFSNRLLTKQVFSTTVSRKIFNTISQCGPAICLIGVSYAGCNEQLAFGLLASAVGLQGAAYSGYCSNPMDIAPNFAGTILGISGTLSNIPGWLAPLTVGLLTNGNQTLERWRIAFLTTAAVMVMDAIFFAIFASGEEQYWNKPQDGSDDKEQPAPRS